MKKLLIMLLVLCLASMANAYVLNDIRLVITDGAGNVLAMPEQAGGHAYPEDSEIVLSPSDTIWIGVWNANGNEPLPDIMVLTTYWGETEMDEGTGACHIYEPPCPRGSTVMYAGDGWGGLPNPYIADIGKAAGGVGPMGIQCGLLFEAEFHCTEPGDVMVAVASLDWDGSYGYHYDTLVIHQIPEPTTIALLGLGGLFLLRRRR